MTSQATFYDYDNLTEEIKAKAASDENARYAIMVAIATITWLLLSCLSAFIYCCNYWQLFGNGDDQSELEEQQQEQQSMLPLTQCGVSDSSSSGSGSGSS